jgi:hypothetical protein
MRGLLSDLVPSVPPSPPPLLLLYVQLYIRA